VTRAAAAGTVLADGGYRHRVREFARRTPYGDGALRAAADLEAMTQS
jgi:hypothetical protein